MDRVYVIRHKREHEGLSIREIARDLGVSRNTVRKYLDGDGEPQRREGGKRPQPVLDAVRERIDELVREWGQRTTPKQRVTGTLVHQRLRAEGYRVGSTTVRAYLAEQRRVRQEVYVPLPWRPGEAAQVDFFEVTVEVAGQRRLAWMFVLHLMYSGRDFAWLYERCNQVAFLDGHVRAFGHLGGVVRRCIYDNLKAAVKRRLGLGRERELSGRFLALCSHYVIEPCFARPGQGHDKGGVEARGKNVRLQHLTPIPRGASLAEIAGRLVEHLDAAAAARRSRQGPERRLPRPPHYPSWGSETRPAAVRGAGSGSLPLMGIGNMGPCAGCATRRSLPHYPSWGSETRWPATRTRRRGRTLITPHGDRKLTRAFRAGALGLSAHYPSWGSETGRSPRRFRPRCCPHYPSWGSETLVCVAHAWYPAGNSLPLMGIGNAPAAACRRGQARSHYPSWGSETRRRFGRSSRRPAHYPSWGSETCMT